LGKSAVDTGVDIYDILVGGFNPFEKYESKWESFPRIGENKQ